MILSNTQLTPEQIAEQADLAKEFRDNFFCDGDNVRGGGYGRLYLKTARGMVGWFSIPPKAREEIEEKGLRRGRKWMMLRVPNHVEALPVIWMP